MRKIYHAGLYLLTLLCSLPAYSQGQITTNNLDTSNVPKEIKFKGKIKTAARWTDQSGDHIVITTETGETKSENAPSDDCRDAALYAYHYIIDKDSTYLIWKVHDFIKQCPAVIEPNLIKTIFKETILNNNGVRKVGLRYKTPCQE